jgi:DNA-binding transcriptional ArsR family regulator
MGDAQVIEMYSTILSAMGNPRRLAILGLLADEEVSVRDLANQVGISQSALSQHLAKLRAAGLVSTRREGQMIFYSSCQASLVPILSDLSDWLGSTPQPDLASF